MVVADEDVRIGSCRQQQGVYVAQVSISEENSCYWM